MMTKQDKIRKLQIEKKLNRKLTNEQYYRLVDMAKKIMSDSKEQFLKGDDNNGTNFNS